MEGIEMPWNEVSVVHQRFELIDAILAGVSVTDAARHAGVSRKTASKWWRRFQDGGWENLDDLSRARKTPSEIKTGWVMVDLVLGIRAGHSTWGGRKIAARLVRDGHDNVPAPSTITEILRRHDLLKPPSRTQRDLIRFEAEHPNDLWQMDFKGDFLLVNQNRCYPLTIIDDHSRYALGLEAVGNQQRATVRDVLIEVFETLGTPRRILCDNGPPWGGSGLGRFTKLGVWLLEHGIEVIHGRPKHPQTQGKDERFHRTLKADVLATREVWDTLATVQQAFDTWRPVYNEYRPHEGIGMDVPADRYQPSPRTFQNAVEPPAYANTKSVRRTDLHGRFSWKGTLYRSGRAFANKSVEVRPDTDTINVYYYTTKIRTISKNATPMNPNT